MDDALTPDELADLLAAYALDALDDDERAWVEAHLARDPEAAIEARELRITASLLASAGGPPPAGVWERLEQAIGRASSSNVAKTSETESAAPVISLPTPEALAELAARRRAERRWRWTAAVAAIAVVLALVFGGLWLGGGGDAGTPSAAALARAAAREPGARRAVLTDDSGRALATAVVTRDGSGYLTARMPTAAGGTTYQLWGISRTATVSLGVLGRHPGTVAFKAAVPTQSLAITTEVAGGVSSTDNAPDAVGDVVAN
jgi:anti-sigma factor RsiW